MTHTGKDCPFVQQQGSFYINTACISRQISGFSQDSVTGNEYGQGIGADSSAAKSKVRKFIAVFFPKIINTFIFPQGWLINDRVRVLSIFYLSSI